MEKGEAAPFAGFVVTEDKVRDLDLISVERDDYRNLSNSLKEQVRLSGELNATLNRRLSVNEYTAVLSFVMGIVLSAATTYVVIQATH